MVDEHYMKMTVKDLNYAMDELSHAIDYLNDFICVNDETFKAKEIEDLKKRIGIQIQNINGYIIPSIHGDG